MTLALPLLVTYSTPLTAQLLGEIPPLPSVVVTRTDDGLMANIGDETLRVSVCNVSVIHVMATPKSPESIRHDQPWILDPKQSCPGAQFQFSQSDDTAILTTATLKVELSLKRGNLKYSNIGGQDLLHESDAVPRTYEPAQVNGENVYHVADRFAPDATEGFYGLGQHQSGMFNYRGSTVELGQNNTDVAIPVLVSSKGYALLWNTASFTYADNRFPLAFQFSSLAANSVDYYLIYGPEMDQIIHEYRSLTGHTPMLPKWAYGFFQSKDRYISREEILGIAHRYREEHIPLDAIVQDWFWWKIEGDPIFNSNFPDVPGELKTLHDEHVHAMISIWGLFDVKSQTFQKLSAQHLDVPNAHVYDATSAKARDVYWEDLAGKLFSQGWDAFWLDSAEPEEYWPHWGDAILRDKQLAIGSGARYTNIFPLMHTNGIQEHWKATTDQKRVFLLTRSAFVGQQRVGATVWSGDVYSTYWGLSHQVAAGLNFALSGYPYWTTDIGGYWQPQDRPPNDHEYQELYTRWFEFGVFCPIFRTHGHRAHNELWTYDKVEPILLNYDKLRYRLMPYIYSLAWRVTDLDYTIQRPLVMDWRTDPKTWNIGDQFMFGPAVLVSPVLKQDATHRTVYLPESPLWYDFWTGASTKGGREVEAEASLDRIPLFVRAGSIVPLGPEIEYADQKPAGPIELRIFRGANGKFDLYEDEGDTYNYEKGAHALIPLRWSETDKTLTIGDRDGRYPGMPKELAFNIVWVSPGHGVGETVVDRPDRVIHYQGEAISVEAP
ncbi:MAG TPA: TIM-barrel domain-containing protein [Terriglobales bacterium]|nr:TIM-barrel domain-containing protein [Terriglobales bacterium]